MPSRQRRSSRVGRQFQRLDQAALSPGHIALHAVVRCQEVEVIGGRVRAGSNFQQPVDGAVKVARLQSRFRLLAWIKRRLGLGDDGLMLGFARVGVTGR